MSAREVLRLPGGGTTVTVLLGGDETEGRLTLLEVALEPGNGAGNHRHTQEDETIVPLDGPLRIDDRTYAPGEPAFLPRGVMHSFRNDGDGPVRALFICTPAGLERFFRAIVTGGDAAVARAVVDAGLEFGT